MHSGREFGDIARIAHVPLTRSRRSYMCRLTQGSREGKDAMRRMWSPSRRVLAGSGIAFLLASGYAHAPIPGGAGVYPAGRLNGVGAIRWSGPSLPTSNALGNCSSLETE